MKGQEMTKEVDTGALNEPSGSLTRIDGAVRPRTDDMAVQTRQHSACGGRSKTHSH